MFTRGGDDFNNKYKAPIEIKKEEEEEEMLSVKEEIEDNRENYMTRSCRVKKTSERHICSYKTSVLVSFLNKFKKNFLPNDII